MKRYKTYGDALMAFRNGNITQHELGHIAQSFRNEVKSKNCIVAGYLPSQFGKVVTNEQRLIDNGHYMKSAEKAKLDYLRESYKKAKKASNKVSEIVLVKKV